MSEYNYKSFPLDADMEDFLRFPDVARVGTNAPEGQLVDAGDERIGDIKGLRNAIRWPARRRDVGGGQVVRLACVRSRVRGWPLRRVATVTSGA